ncbi:MAG: aspartate carbamoyltransferase regulatory subunit [Bacteroidaceae bacterium]|nr:aspartate carbamoyltransferase regulatory subunit [Bacteroidaceae bacterium]
MKKSELVVAALENGTVIDHIPPDKVFDVVNLLKLQEMTTQVTIGANLFSHKMGRKGIIKIADRYFTDEEVSKLSVIVPNIVITTIHDYEVTEKHHVTMPDKVVGIVRCLNPKCITNHEPVRTVFNVTDKEAGTLRCHYCNKEIYSYEIKLV